MKRGGLDTSRLGNCEICQINPAKYTCPGCSLSTCSLACVKKHKVDKDCDGVRPRSTFRKLSKLTNFDLHQDFKLLEEVHRTVEISQQETKKVVNKIKGGFIPRRLFLLRSHLLRIGTRLLFLPATFEKHKQNKSYLNTHTQVVNWTLQLTFLNAEKLTILDEKWPDNVPVKTLIEKYIDSSELPPSAFQRLRCYREAGINLIHLLLKADKVSGADRTFYKLDLDKTLGENLIGKTIVEIPQLFAVIQDFYRSTPIQKTQKTRQKNLKGESLFLSGESIPDNEIESESDDCGGEIEGKVQASLPKRTYKDLILK